MILNQDLVRVTFRVPNIGENIVIYDDKTMSNITGPTLVFDPDAVVGLDDIPSVRRDKTSRPTSHGTFGETGYIDPRVITLTGHALAFNSDQLHDLRDKLAMALNTGTEFALTFQTRTSTRTVTGYLDSGMDWVQMYDTYAKWKFDIYCPDPRMYGQPAENPLKSSFGILDETGTGIKYPITYPITYSATAATVMTTLSNAGNSISYPVFKFTGATEGFSISATLNRTQGTVGTITFVGKTGPNETVTLDMARGRLTVGGSDRSYMLTKRDWITIPPKSSITPRLRLNPSTDIDKKVIVNVEYRDTYI